MNKAILAIETTEKVCGVAVLLPNGNYSETITFIERIHSNKILPLIEQTLNNAGLLISDIGVIAVSSGPGSFTGLRIGYAVAKALAFANSIPICPIPTHEAISTKMIDCISENSNFSVLNRVNREEFYLSRFKKQNNIFKLEGSLKIISQNEINDEFFNGDEKVFCINDTLPVTKCVRLDGSSPLAVAKCCSLKGEDIFTFEYDTLEPNYVKEFIIKEKKRNV